MRLRHAARLGTFAVTHPRLTVRKMRGQDLIEISIDEIASRMGDVTHIVEAGALDGTDTVRLALRWPGATIHAFEPVPDSFAELSARVADHQNVKTYAIALSDKIGTSRFHLSSGADGSNHPDSSSLLAPTGHLHAITSVVFPTTIEVHTETLDSWAASHEVDSIDLMWLDMQGMEIAVLRASKQILPSVRAVVMEVSRRELYAATPLYPEVKAWMRSQGFSPAIDRVGHLFGNILFIRD